MDRATNGEKIVLGSAVVLFLLSFLKPWAKISFGEAAEQLGGGDVSLNVWDSYNFFPLKFGLILALIAIGLVVANMAGTNLNIPPQTLAGLGGATLLMVLLSFLTGPAGSGTDFLGAGIDRGLLLFVAVIPAAGMAIGGYMHMQEGGGSVPSFGGGPSASPPPPPT